MAANLDVVELDLSLVPTQSANPLELIRQGLCITSIGIEFLDPAAAGLIFLRIGGPGARPIPLSRQGRAWRIPQGERGGLWLDNIGNTFAAGTMLAIAVGFDNTFEAVS